MRQAVVIIHGIGEQRPMQTLRAFVAGVLGGGESDLTLKKRIFSKPDRISDTLELRRLSVRPGKYSDNYELSDETDFYELYWQHLMQGTTSRPVLEWALHLLFHPNKLNSRLRRVWWGVVAIMAAVAIALTVALLVLKPLLAVGLAIIVPALLTGLRFLKWLAVGQVERLVLGFAGDAFRYLNPDPPNVQVRRAIRTAGLTLLRGLHEDELRRYERIILVGHSLGSVIAYDLITWFWQEQHNRVKLDLESGERKTVVMRHVESSPAADEDPSPLKKLDDPSSVEKFRKSQQVLWRYYQKRLPWLITDLVTLGSPLSHADVLLADGLEKLELGKDQREFPTCPPKGEDCRDRGLLCRAYVDANNRAHEVRILHHGAPFAITRWTNLYFPADIIGGPVSHLFGPGIKDVNLGSCGARSWRSHVHYWKHKSACRELREALFARAKPNP
jgi:hypothetical protein